jgi:hypothetical protein
MEYPEELTHLKFRVVGTKVNPGAITEVLGFEPTETFLVGERSGRYVKDKAGWEWKTNDGDLEELLTEFKKLFGPKSQAVGDFVAAGARASLTILTHLTVDLIATPEEAEEKKWWWGQDDPEVIFKPFLGTQSIMEHSVDADTMRLLLLMGATLSTYGEVMLSSEL